MKKSNRPSRRQPDDLEQALDGARFEEGAGDLLRQLRKPARKLMAAILRDRQKKIAQPDQGVIEFDSALLPLPEGVRPAAVETRRLRFRLESGVVDLTLYPLSTEGWELIGQLIDDDDSNRELRVQVGQGRTKRTVEANQVNVFRIDHLMSGPVQLKLLSDSGNIGTIDLEI